MGKNYRRCTEPHLRDYPGCAEECDNVYCIAPGVDAITSSKPVPPIPQEPNWEETVLTGKEQNLIYNNACSSGKKGKLALCKAQAEQTAAAYRPLLEQAATNERHRIVELLNTKEWFGRKLSANERITCLNWLREDKTLASTEKGGTK